MCMWTLLIWEHRVIDASVKKRELDMKSMLFFVRPLEKKRNFIQKKTQSICQ
jgi:hypothetical protein